MMCGLAYLSLYDFFGFFGFSNFLSFGNTLETTLDNSKIPTNVKNDALGGVRTHNQDTFSHNCHHNNAAGVLLCVLFL